MARVFLPGWHVLGTLADLPNHGDFFTAELLGKPLIARNERGSIRVFLNVCAHRHALLTHAPRGSGKRLRCQYHGWEYDGDGVACKIPDAACFVPIRRGAERLRAVRAEVLGQLLLVCLDDDAPGPREYLGERVVAVMEQCFSPGLRQAVSLSLEHPCNWKIPLENVLESYHVPSLHDNFVARHPGLFRLFRGEQAGQREVHELTDRFTTVRDTLGADSALYRGLLARLRPGASTDFVHLHAFPSLLLGHTSVVSFLQVTTPTSPTTSRSLVRFFLDLGQPDRSLSERLLAPLVDRLTRELFEGLMREDAPVFPDLQRGLAASPHPGVLGSREERIHAFHQFILRACSGG
jgi:nitrite reductase/ring-hydroxylating ferredoxin subunit